MVRRDPNLLVIQKLSKHYDHSSQFSSSPVRIGLYSCVTKVIRNFTGGSCLIDASSFFYSGFIS